MKVFVLFGGLILLYLITAYFWALKTSDLAIFQYDQKHKIEKVQLSEEQLLTLLKVEDPSFLNNSGIDIFTPGQGKTTITQSVVPILLFNSSLYGWREILQNVYSKIWSSAKKIDLGRDAMALAVSKKVSKDKILNIFIEQAYMGSINNEAIFGLSKAADKYFNKSVSKLSHDEFAKLVSMLKSPDYYNPIKNPEALDDRTKRVLKLLNGSCFPDGLFDTDYKSCI
jgi:membrane carboxypeptidase/penicillin-binding protein